MSERPTPVTTTDVLIDHLIDEVAGLRADLAGRGGTTAPPPPPKAAAKKTAAKGKKPVAVDGT